MIGDYVDQTRVASLRCVRGNEVWFVEIGTWYECVFGGESEIPWAGYMLIRL